MVSPGFVEQYLVSFLVSLRKKEFVALLCVLVVV